MVPHEGFASNRIFDVLADWEAVLKADETPVLTEEPEPDIQP